MKNTSLLAILLYAISTSASAQKTDKPLLAIQYSLRHVIDTTQRDYPIVRPFMLVLGEQMSLYDDYYGVMWLEDRPVKKTIVGPDGKLRETTMGSGGGGDGYIKHTRENKLTTVTYAGSSYYAIDEPLPSINWKISEEQKTIKAYKCQKATARFKGRNYTAWFTDQLPYRNGPWKLGGLPGLILEANDDTNEIIFECTSIDEAKDFKPIEVPSDAIVADAASVKKVQDAVKNNTAAMAGTSIMRSSNVSAVSVPIEGAPAGRPPRKFSNPIEKEDK